MAVMMLRWASASMTGPTKLPGSSAGAELRVLGGFPSRLSQGLATGLFEGFHEFCADDGGLFGRFHDDGVAGDECGGGHAEEDGEREIPGGDDDRDAARLEEVEVLLAGDVFAPGLAEAEHFAG